MTEPASQTTELTCDRCGRFGAQEFGDHRLCDDCRAEAGACCAPDDAADPAPGQPGRAR